ncbi:alpha/beta hydrolase fold domain-containing protein [Paenibacillus sp. LS1]|uniref:alpha/beta hydrolase fold domain-containing protein n=1 Tax=Paenibacillus sp. LS1 TaxID=2992120 RepID=UPI002230EE7B|nr:alpha/beta hydrolase [Paenibacillus sp. LS1]
MMRSIRSFLVERLLVLTKKKLNVDDYMEERGIINSLPYVLPVKLKNKYKIIKDNNLPIDTYILKSDSQSDVRIILYLPGGGYVEQPLTWHWHFLHNLTQQLNCTVYAPIYPKAPTYQYMDAIESVLSIYKQLLEIAEPENIVLMGDSAGGGLSLAFAQYLSEKGLPQPGNIILLSPWLDITLSNPEIVAMIDKEPMLDWEVLVEAGKRYAGETSRTHYLVSPINGDITNLGKISLFIGTHEFFLPDARKFKEIASQKSVDINYYEYPKMNHVFPVFPIPEAKKALKQIISIIKS